MQKKHIAKKFAKYLLFFTLCHIERTEIKTSMMRKVKSDLYDRVR